MKVQKKTGRSDRRFAVPEVADRYRYLGAGPYTPARLQAIFAAANSGDTEKLCLCGREILERNWDVIGAMEQRSAALLGAEWNVLPGGDAPQDADAARAFDAALRQAGDLNEYGSFYDLVSHLLDAVVLPFAASEIIWSEGGNLAGFANLESHHFTLRESFTPRLVCDQYPMGMPEEEQRNRFIFHQSRRKADPARGGRIRVLAWLHCFQNWPLKDLFSFIERFGMPFVIAKVDQNTWENERQVLHSLIRSFGPNGGGVFTKNTELQLLNASNTGGDNVYFRALEFTHNAIYTLLVGQLASSGDSAGMSNGDAQSAVRQDILAADARAIEATVRTRIAAPWTSFHYPGAAVPKLKFQVEPAEDQTRLATVVSTLSTAGFKPDAEELSRRFGMKLRYEPPAAVPEPGGSAPQYRQEVQDNGQDTLNLKQKYEAMGVAIRAGLLTATPEIEEQTRRELGLPEMSNEVKKAWEATGGIRQPITLKNAEAEAVSEALDVDDDTDKPGDEAALAAEKTEEKGLAGALEEWLGPLADGIAGTAELPDAELDRRLRAGNIAAPGDSTKLENAMLRDMKKVYADGIENSRR